MMRTINYTKQFKRDYKSLKKSGQFKNTLDKDLIKVLELLVSDIPLPNKNFDHQLTGNWKDHRDCHIKPDLILIYRRTDDNMLDLVRIGSHSQLGL